MRRAIRYGVALVVLALVAGVAGAQTLVGVDDSYGVPYVPPLVVEAPGVIDNDTYNGGPAAGAGATVALIGSPSFGTLECDSDPVAYDLCPDGSFSYTAGAGFPGFDSFTYEVAVGTSTDLATVVLSACTGGPTQFKCWQEAAYLTKLGELGYSSFTEGFENDAVWGVTRFPLTEPSVLSQGIRWRSNHPDPPASNELTTGSGPAHTGLWGVYDPEHGYATGTPEECDITNPPAHCLFKDGVTGTKEGGGSTLVAVGGYFTGSLQPNLVMILDGGAPIGLGMLAAGSEQYFGVIDTGGLTSFRVEETDGKIGQERHVFADDFTLGTAAADTVPPRVVLVNSIEDTGDGVLAEGEATDAFITELLVYYSEPVQDLPGDTDPHDVTNPANYLLFGDGGNGFQTVNCAGGVAAGDVEVAVDAVTYTSGSVLEAVVSINGGLPLPVGSYRLLVCGTTSIRDWAGNALDGNGNGTGGDDFVRNFSIILPVNHPPVANPQAVTTPEDTPKAITLTGSDPDLDPLTYSTVTGPSNGVLSGTPPNVTYTPAAHYHGPDSFTFRVWDGTVFSNPATVSITVTSVNDPPVADPQAVSTPEDAARAITLTASDIDFDPLTYSIVTGPAHGALSGTPPSVTYTPAANYNGPDSFTFRAWDGAAFSNTATVSITVTAVNDPPVANPQAVTTPQNTPLAITLTGSDPDGNPLTYAIGTPPAHGSLTGTPPNVTYTPTTSYVGPDSFTFTVNDGTVTSAPATVSITVTESPLSVLTIGNASVIEGDAGPISIEVTITLTPASTIPVSVGYATGGGTATAGADYTAASGTADFPIGATTAIVPLDVLGDLLDEPDEEFGVALSNPVGATLGTPSAGTVTIFDDDPMPDLSGVDLVVDEYAGQAAVELTLSGPSGFDITVDYVTADGTATAPADYGSVSGTAFIAAGSLATTVPIPIADDALIEGDELFTLELSNPGNAVLLTPSITVTIRDDDGTAIFDDGFESGDASHWSVVVP